MILAEFLEQLPYALRAQVEGYVQTVDDALPSIADDANVRVTPALRSDFLALAALRKLYVYASAQRWTLQRSFSLLRASNVAEFRIGPRVVSEGSPEVVGLRNFLVDFERLLDSRELRTLSSAPLADLLRLVADGRL